MSHLLAQLDDAQVTAIAGALVALAVPVNTFLLILLNRRQKRGNHHTETIRQLAAAVISDEPRGDGLEKIPPEELGERVAEAAKEAAEGKG